MIKMQTIEDNEMGEKLLNTIQSHIKDAMNAVSILQSDFENESFLQATENKLSGVIIEIRKKLQERSEELECEELLDFECRIKLQIEIRVAYWNV